MSEFDISKVKKFVELNEKRNELKSQIVDIEEELDGLEKELTNSFEKAGVPNIRVDGHTVYIHKQVWAGYKDSRDKAIEALRKNGLNDYIYETYNTHSLSAYFREKIRDYEDENGFINDVEDVLDPGLKEHIKLTEKISLRSRKSK